MLRDIPQNDREQFHELGEGFAVHHGKVPLPNTAPYAVPTRECRRTPTRDTMMAYSFFQQGMGVPRHDDGILLLPIGMEVPQKCSMLKR
jgi:hypothetical protein